MKINIGSGTSKFPGFINCDKDSSVNPDRLFDLGKDLFPFKDNTVNEVVADYVLEYLDADQLLHCMQELYRICAPEATIHVKFPHHRSDIFWMDPTKKCPLMVETFRLMSKKHSMFAKETNWRVTRIAEKYNIDFEVVNFNYIPNEYYRQKFETLQHNVAEEYISEHWNIIHEVYVKLAVVK